MEPSLLTLSLISKEDQVAEAEDRALVRAATTATPLVGETVATTEAVTRDATVDAADRAEDSVEISVTTEVVWAETTATKVENPARIKGAMVAAIRETTAMAVQI